TGNGHDILMNDCQVASMTKLYGQNYWITLERLAESFRRNLSKFKDLPFAEFILEGIRAGTESENPALRFWARFIVELGRYSALPYDLADPATKPNVRLDAIQSHLILMRLAGDLAVLEKGAKATAATTRISDRISVA